MTRRQVLGYNAKSYRRACCRSENTYFNFINHIMPYIILTSTKFWMCPYNFRKYRTYCELVEFGETTIYFQARSVFRHSKMRENVAETTETVDIAPVGIDYGIPAYFLLFQYASLSKIFCQISVKKSSCACTILSPTNTIFLFHGCEISWKSESALCKY